MDDTDNQNSYAVWTLAMGLVILTALLFIITRLLRFKFVLGVGD